MRLRFGDVTFDTGRRALFRGPQQVHLSPKAFRFLELLLSKRPDAVAKEEILETVWPDVVVSEASLAALARDVRKALGGGAEEPPFLRTVHGFGYAFDGQVEEIRDGAPAPRRHLLVWGTQEMPLGEGENVLGRERSAAVWVGHPSVSREHARLVVVGERAEIEDLKSKNGTWLGSRRVEGRLPLADGDEVRVGEVRLLYRGPAGGHSEVTKSVR
ncbi:MAG TPA: FHA domain-containing protein [Thermoanaerobaculia bacterium]|nr:FHA domain-containing protein [Thermoanaerobaculia bacterium]HQR66564.1 FHA domain-containing protein [Thermoanaerobaculia bacterium]